ncbi:hypothetical protein T492DRAFT_853293, partial [Pavlovales sp. CCMP2436]
DDFAPAGDVAVEWRNYGSPLCSLASEPARCRMTAISLSGRLLRLGRYELLLEQTTPVLLAVQLVVLLEVQLVVLPVQGGGHCSEGTRWDGGKSAERRGTEGTRGGEFVVIAIGAGSADLPAALSRLTKTR